MKFSELVKQLGDSATCNSLTLMPTLDPEITELAPVDAAAFGTLSYIDGKKFAHLIESTNASGLIIYPDEALQIKAQMREIAWIANPSPRLLFTQVINFFYQPFRPTPEIHPSAIIHPSAQLGKDLYIGAHVVIQAGVKIGDGVCIHPNVVIYPQVQIGDRTVLHANCTIHERTRIGADCMIHSGAVIGSEGFGFVYSPQGWVKMEQSGYTVLEDGVEVGCNSTIDRPAVGETRVGRNTKIDNLVQIGHSCQVGQDCIMAAQVGLAGSSKIGNRVILGGQVGVNNQVQVGDGVIASAKAGIHTNVEPGQTVSGYPVMPHQLWLKTAALHKRLPEIYHTLKELQCLLESAKSEAENEV